MTSSCGLADRFASNMWTSKSATTAAAAAFAAVFCVLVLRRRRHGSAHTGTPPATPHPKNVAALDPPDQPAPLDPPAVALTPRTVRLLFATADAVGSEDAAGEFYAALFARAPDLKQLFDDDGTKQRRKFADMMRWVTRALGGGLNGNEGGLSESLKALGRRHARYGVRLRHFHPVKAALLETIASLDYGGTEAAAVSPADVTRAWEGLVYVFVGEMGPVLLPNDPLADYCEALSNDLAAPAGGTATAVAAAHGAALLLMAVRLTRPPPTGGGDCSATRQRLQDIEGRLMRCLSAFEALARQDMAAYCRVMAAVRQPLVGGEDGKRERREAIGAALGVAAGVPLRAAEWAVHALHCAIALVPLAAKSGVGDAGAGAGLIVTAARTALQNVRINAGTRPELRAVAARGDVLAATLAWQGGELERLLP